MKQGAISIESYKCQGCGKTTVLPKLVCPKCGSTDIVTAQSEGKGKIIDSTIVYFPPDDYKDLAPYTSVLVQLNNGCKLFGVIKGEIKDIPLGSPVTLIENDEGEEGYFFQLD